MSHIILQLHPMLLLALFVVSFSAAGAYGTYLFRKYIRMKIGNSHNDVAGNIFAMAGGFYGLLLAFVVFLVWDQFNGAQTNADIEGSLARGLYRDIKFYPITAPNSAEANEIKMLTYAYENYINDALKEDSLVNSDGVESRGYVFYRDTVVVRSLNKVFEIMERIHDTELYKNQRIDQMFRHLNELNTYRGLRLLSVSSEISYYIWVPLLLGGLIIAFFAMLMDIENRRLHCTMNGLLGGFIALIFYIIVISDHPFIGRVRVDIKNSMGKVLEWERGGMMETRRKGS